MNMKYLWAAVCCMAAGLTQAAPPSKASVEKLFEVQDFNKSIDDALKTSPAVILNSQYMQNNLAAVPPEKREKVKEIVKRYLTDSMKRLNTPQNREIFRKAAVEGAQKVYTQREVDALIKFYDTPEGRSIMAKMPQYMDATMTPIFNIVGAEMQKFQQQNQNKVQQEINRAVCGKNACAPQPQSK